MPAVVIMPSLSPTMKKGNLVKWCKNIGEEVKVGEIVAEIDTDKATMEVESLYDGVLAKILVPEGTHNVLVKTKIAVIKQKGDTDRAVEEAASAAVTNTEEPQEEVSLHIKASPLAKRIAKEHGVDISTIEKGSGPGGRIVKADVSTLSFVESSSEAFEDKIPSSFRVAMLDKLVQSSQKIPHFYMQITADVTDLMRLLKSIKENNLANVKITMNEFVVRAVALAIKKHPAINVSWLDGNIRQYRDIDISVAVAVEDGIYAPVIRNVDSKNIKEVAKEIRELAEKAKQRQLKAAETNDGGITISSLGMCEINCFYSIINPPQASIISVARAVQSPVISREGRVQAGYSLTLGYAVDHRAIDGLNAGKFLTSLKQLLENPAGMLL